MADFFNRIMKSKISKRILAKRIAKLPLFIESRRSLLKFILGAPVLLACQASNSKTTKTRIELGLAKDFAQGITIDQVKRLAVKRVGESYSVLSMLCTHQACALHYNNQEFVCPCHGARFNSAGQVLQGPAEKNLEWVTAEVNLDGRLIYVR